MRGVKILTSAGLISLALGDVVDYGDLKQYKSNVVSSTSICTSILADETRKNARI
jgi:hypothetical protein